MLCPSPWASFDGRLCFRANDLLHGNNVELRAFDGTVAGIVADINSGTNGSDPSFLVNTGYCGMVSADLVVAKPGGGQVRELGALLVGAGLGVFLSVWLGAVLAAAGAFVLFEALRGWCVLRACGLKTRL